MALMLQSGIIEEIPKMVELAKGYLFNGAYYNKKDLTPIPFQQYNSRGYTNELALNKVGTTNLWGGLNNIFLTKIIDSNNANITYLFGYKASNNILVSKMLEDNNNVSCLRTNEIGHASLSASTSQSYSKVIEVLKQDNNYLYLLTQGSAYTSIVKLNKITLVVDSSCGVLTTYGQIKILKKSNDSIYFVYIEPAAVPIVYVYKYSYSTNVTTKLLQYNLPVVSNANNNCSQYLDILYSINAPVSSADPSYYEEFHFVVRGALANSAGTYYYIPAELGFKVWYNIDQATDVSFRWLIDISTSSMQDLQIANNGDPNLLNAAYNQCKYVVKNCEDGTKLLCYFNYYTNTSTSTINKYFMMFHLGQKADGLFYIIDAKQYDNSSYPIVNVYVSSDKNVIYIMKYQQPLEVWVWNESSKLYVQTKKVGSSVVTFGIDDYDNLWLTDENGLHWFASQDIPVDISITPVDNIVGYNNANIQTAIRIGATDVNNNLISAQLTLVINGDAVFTTNNSKSIDIATSATGLVDQPITITGPGKISVTPKFYLT